MHVTWLYSDADGESRFADLTLPVDTEGSGWYTDFVPAEGVSFQYRPVREHDYHRAPRRQLVIVVEGRIEVQVGDGDTRTFGPGDVLLADDTEGRGHITRRTQAGLSLYISLPTSLNLELWRVQ